MDYFSKLGKLFIYCIKYLGFNTYEIISIDKCEIPGEYAVSFMNLANKKCFSKSITDLYNDQKILNKFDFEDVIKIGNYYAKSLYEQSKYK